MKINVDAHHIASGHVNSCMTCPVALAIAQALSAPGVFVDGDSIAVGFCPDDVREYPTPPAVIAFIDRFDSGLPVEPFSFELGNIEEIA